MELTRTSIEPARLRRCSLARPTPSACWPASRSAWRVRASGSDLTVGPRAGLDADVERVGGEVSAPGPRHGSAFAVDGDLREACRRPREVEDRAAHAFENRHLAAEP